MTREERCRDCELSDDATGRLECPYFGVGLLAQRQTIRSACALRAAWSNAEARCPHPDGDRWAGVEPVALGGCGGESRAVGNSGLVAHQSSLTVLQERVRCCKGHGDRPRCKYHEDPWTCRGFGEPRAIGSDLHDPKFACPRGAFHAAQDEK